MVKMVTRRALNIISEVMYTQCHDDSEFDGFSIFYYYTVNTLNGLLHKRRVLCRREREHDMDTRERLSISLTGRKFGNHDITHCST